MSSKENPSAVALQRIIDNRYYVSDLEDVITQQPSQETEVDYEKAKARINSLTPFELLQIIFMAKSGMMETVNRHEKLLDGVSDGDLRDTINSVDYMELQAMRTP